MNLKLLLQSDLSDLKNIKLDDVRSGFRSKPMAGFRVLLIVVAIAVLIFGFSSGRKRKQGLMVEIDEKQRKLQVFQELQQTTAEYNSFFGGLPKSIDRDDILKEISGLAEKKQIKINSFFPGDRKLNDLIRANVLDLNVVSEDYQNLVEFIELIEESPYLMRVERWSARMIQVNAGDGRETRNIIEGKLGILGLIISQEAWPAK